MTAAVRGIGGLGLLAAFVLVSTHAWATGFAVDEQSTFTLGTAQAGRAAIADDADTVFFNPAGMVRLTRPEAASAAIVIFPASRFHNHGSSIGGQALMGGNSGNAAEHAIIPVTYLASGPIDVSGIPTPLQFGLAINVPFGLSTNYDNGWVGRYQSLESSLHVININPAVAVDLGHGFSLGAGFDAQYLQAKLTNAIDFGSVIGMPQALDGQAKLDGSSWAFGYNLGLLYQYAENGRIGITYRSQVHHDIDTNANFSVPPPANFLKAAGLFVDSNAKTDLTLPESVSVSLYQALGSKFTLLTDITWTRWSRFKELVVKFDNPAQPTIEEDEDWNDTFRLSIGGIYALSPQWQIRGGFMYDPTPVPSGHEKPRLFIGDRYALAAGVGYQLNTDIKLDAAVLQSFSPSVHVNNRDPTGGTLKGSADTSATLFALQFSYKF
jgi:long-chain fatty acid transport protein